MKKFWRLYGTHIKDAVLALIIGSMLATAMIYAIMLIANGSPHNL